MSKIQDCETVEEHYLRLTDLGGAVMDAMAEYQEAREQGALDENFFMWCWCIELYRD